MFKFAEISIELTIKMIKLFKINKPSNIIFELYHKVNKITAYSKTWPGLTGMARPHWHGFKIGPAHFWPQIWLVPKCWPRFNNWSGFRFGIYNIRREMLNSSAGIGSEETDIKFLLGREISAWLVYTGNVCNLAI